MKGRGNNNNLLREVGGEAGIVDEIKQVLTKTQVGDAHDPHSWHESEVRVSVLEHVLQALQCRAALDGLVVENMDCRFLWTSSGSMKGS